MKPRLNKSSRSKLHQGVFTPKNPKKYVGTTPIIARSSWEYKVMTFFDSHPNIVCWSSESVKIPYLNPFKLNPKTGAYGKIATYYPDFAVIYKDKDGKEVKEIIEVKPLKESVMEKAKSKRDKLAVVLNTCKWEAAKKFCKEHNMLFRVITEADLFKM